MGQDENRAEIQYVVWKPEMSVCSKAIDVQHRQVVALLNEVNLALRTPGRSAEMDALLFRLRIFTETHFAYEETVLRLIGYPGLEQHRQTHAAMIEKTKEVIAELSRSQDYPTLLHFLRDWWLGHIQGVDKLYISYVEKLGL
jgi:hemerythrin